MTDRAAIELCFESIATHSKSFALASKVLPAECRADAAVAYAWCRRADDAIDLAPPAEQPAALARLREELRGVYAGEAQTDPVLAAFQQVVQARRVPMQYPMELLAGMEMDVEQARYRTLDDLLVYCWRVAGTVGLVMCHVMGVRDPAALRRAAHLGMAMQITNICRDVREDWERGRLYVPTAMLPAADDGWIPPPPGAELSAPRGEALRTAVRDLLVIADRMYRSGDDGVPALSFRCALAVRTARAVYSAIGVELARRGWDVLGPRAVVSTARKLALLARAALATVAELPARVGTRFRPAPLANVLRYPHDVLPV